MIKGLAQGPNRFSLAVLRLEPLTTTRHCLQLTQYGAKTNNHPVSRSSVCMTPVDKRGQTRLSRVVLELEQYASEAQSHMLHSHILGFHQCYRCILKSPTTGCHSNNI